MTTSQQAAHEVIESRKYRHVVAVLDNGQRTARWSQDKTTGHIYMSGAWGRADRSKLLNLEQSCYVLDIIARVEQVEYEAHVARQLAEAEASYTDEERETVAFYREVMGA